MKIRICCYFHTRFQYPYRFLYQSRIICVLNFWFLAVIYFALSIHMNILTLYNNCYVILTTYMLDSALEPSYNLSKNLLLLPWILKLIVDMVINDSTHLIYIGMVTKKYILANMSTKDLPYCPLKNSFLRHLKSKYCKIVFISKHFRSFLYIKKKITRIFR